MLLPLSHLDPPGRGAEDKLHKQHCLEASAKLQLILLETLKAWGYCTDYIHKFLSGVRLQGGGKKIDTENLLRDNLLLSQQQYKKKSGERSVY